MRPYQPGDRIARIHWAASARLSAARGTDEFLVREYFAEQAPWVALARDPSPSLAINAPPSPWLDKRAASQRVVELVAASAVAEHSELVYADGAPRPRLLRAPLRRALEDRSVPGSSLAGALTSLLRGSAGLPPGSFVFVVSDFFSAVPARLWLRLTALGLDVTPVIVQDVIWEQTFPRVGGVVLPLVDAATGTRRDTWLTTREAHEQARANEKRLEELRTRFRKLGFDSVLIDSTEPEAIRRPFLAWAERRRRTLRLGA